MLFGRSKYEQFDLKSLVKEAFNLADYIPWLGPFDLQVSMIINRAIVLLSKFTCFHCFLKISENIQLIVDNINLTLY